MRHKLDSIRLIAFVIVFAPLLLGGAAQAGRPEVSVTASTDSSGAKSVTTVATFTVNATADLGTGARDTTECTLREAIIAANAAAGSDTINFNIPGSGVCVEGDFLGII